MMYFCKTVNRNWQSGEAASRMISIVTKFTTSFIIFTNHSGKYNSGIDGTKKLRITKWEKRTLAVFAIMLVRVLIDIPCTFPVCAPLDRRLILFPALLYPEISTERSLSAHVFCFFFW
jgi:hypothetical protein